MNKKEASFSHFGFSTILMVFIMICLVTFAALSLLSANSDYKLSRKTADKTTGYYNADANARSYLYRMDLCLAELYGEAADESAYFQELPARLELIDIPGGLTNNIISVDANIISLSFEAEISDFQRLYVTLKMNYPQAENDNFYEITRWQTKASLEPSEEDDILHLLNNENQ